MEIHQIAPKQAGGILQTKVKYIYHTADLHIGNGLNRRDERNAIFAKFIGEVANSPDLTQTVVAICGDIFHFKTRLSPEDIVDFKALLEGIDAICPSFIIPGNHDLNTNNDDRMDLLTVIDLIKPKNMYCIKTTCVVEYCNLYIHHISIVGAFNPATAMLDIAKPKPNMTTVGLYHDYVDGVVSGGKTSTGCDVSKAIVASHDLFLMGHIHDTQFITPTCAYPGSIMQQNAGESFDKGYIRWDVDTCIGTFMRIEGDSGYIRVNISGDNIAYQQYTPKTILGITLITDAQPDGVDAQTAVISAHYGKPVCNVIHHAEYIEHGNKDAVPEIGQVSTDIQLNCIRDNLASRKIAEVDIDKIIQIHGNHQTEKKIYRKWTIKTLYWDNLYCYGKGNFIDFAKLNGLSGIVAPNAWGKSSVFDIIIYGLFNHIPRGTRKSINNASSGTGKDKINHCVKVMFVVNDEKYYIIRKLIGSNNIIRLYKYEVGAAAAAYWKNITLADVTSTYKHIAELIGSYSEFLSTGMALQFDNYDISSMTSGGRNDALSHLFGVSDLKGVEAEERSVIRANAAVLNSMTAPMQTVAELDAATTQLQAEITELTHKVSQLETAYESANREKEALIPLRKERTAAEQNAKIRDLESRMRERTTQIHKLTALLPDNFRKIALSNLTYNQCRDIAVIQRDIDAITDTCDIDFNGPSVKTQLRDLHLQIEVLAVQVGKVVNITTLRGAATSLRAQMDKIKLTEVTQAHHDAASKQIKHMEHDIAELENKILPSNDDIITHIVTQLRKMKKTDGLTFNPTCTNCTSNKHIISPQEDELTAKLEKLKIEKEKIKQTNSGINSRISANRETINKCNSTIADYRTYVAAKMNAERLGDKLTRVAEEIERHEANQSNIEQLAALRREYAAVNAIMETRGRYIDLKNELLDAHSAKTADNIRAYNAHIAANTADATVLAQMKSKVDKYTASDTAKARLVVLNRDITANVRDTAATSNKLKDEELRQQSNTINHLAAVEYEQKYPQLEEANRIHKLYLSAIDSKTGIQRVILNKYLEHLIKHVNMFLSNVANFTIGYEDTPAHVNLNILQNNTQIPVDLGSGFQKFVVKLAFRMGLTKVLPATSSFLMIDEGFGCLDDSNLHNINRIFDEYKTHFDFIIIVSHVDYMQTILNSQITISRSGGADAAAAPKSEIVYGAEEDGLPNMNAGIAAAVAKKAIIAPIDVHIVKIDDNTYKCNKCDKTIKRASLAGHKRTKKHNE